MDIYADEVVRIKAHYELDEATRLKVEQGGKDSYKKDPIMWIGCIENSGQKYLKWHDHLFCNTATAI